MQIMSKATRGCAMALLVCLPRAQAGDSIDLRVSATFDVAACTPSLDHNGEASFGNIPLDKLSKTETNQLGSQYLTLTITCAEDTPIGWSITDNKKDSVQALVILNPKFTSSENDHQVEYEFGLGKTAQGVNLGAYAVYTDLNNVTGDGNKLKLMYKYSTTGVWYTSGSGEIKNDSAAVNAGEPWGSNAAIPVSAKTYIWPLKITAALQATDILKITDTTPLMGSATISLIYL